MRSLALHILDIAENSVRAGASLVEIEVAVSDGFLIISIKDDGCGMDGEFLKKVIDPFTTTRTTREVGLGIPLFKQAAETSGGKFSILSEPGKGTEVYASFALGHIDRMPLGNLADILVALVPGESEILFTYRIENNGAFVFDTREIKKMLGGVPADSPEILVFLKGYLEENINAINGGLTI